jgi:serine/threonine-protein kinase
LTPPGADSLPGTRIAGYEVEQLLGRGGLGSVVLAREASGAQVALKLIDLGGDDDGALHRTFEREVALSRRLHHPGIVSIRDAGCEGDLAYIAMEYVAGDDLARLRRDGPPMQVHRAIEIAADVAHALAHAHGLGIVHHDIKPANILVDSATGRVKLADFGLARLADQQRSRTGVLAGTPAYMSPEQLAEGAQDARADLYSLGVVLFELLTGRLPYEATSLGDLLRQVSQRPAPPLQGLRHDAPPALSALVARLLEKSPERRPPSAQSLAAELDALLGATADRPPPDRPLDR